MRRAITSWYADNGDSSGNGNDDDEEARLRRIAETPTGPLPPLPPDVPSTPDRSITDASPSVPGREPPVNFYVADSQMSGALGAADIPALIPERVQASISGWLRRWANERRLNAREQEAKARQLRHDADEMSIYITQMEAIANNYDIEYLQLHNRLGSLFVPLTRIEVTRYQGLTRAIPQLAADLAKYRAQWEAKLSQARALEDKAKRELQASAQLTEQADRQEQQDFERVRAMWRQAEEYERLTRGQPPKHTNSDEKGQ